MAFFPALMQPTMEKITGDDSLALGHFGSSCYFISAQIGKLFKGGKSSEEVSFPQGLSFLRGAFVHGVIVTFFAAALLLVLGNFGFANTTFSARSSVLSSAILPRHSAAPDCSV